MCGEQSDRGLGELRPSRKGRMLTSSESRGLLVHFIFGLLRESLREESDFDREYAGQSESDTREITHLDSEFRSGFFRSFLPVGWFLLAARILNRRGRILSLLPRRRNGRW